MPDAHLESTQGESFLKRTRFDFHSLVWRSIEFLFSREMFRAPLAEFLGVGIFVLMGTASECQAVLSLNTKISPISKGVRVS